MGQFLRTDKPEVVKRELNLFPSLCRLSKYSLRPIPFCFSYTMTGSRANFEERGIIPRTLSYIFERFHDVILDA